MVDAYSDLLFAKFVSATLLTLSSCLGLVAPFFIFRLIGAQHHAQHRPHAHVDPPQPVSTTGSRRSAHDDVDRAASGGGNVGVALRSDDFPHAPVSGATPNSGGSDYHGPLLSVHDKDVEWNAVAVSCANCVSAGILLWTGLMHFFVESAESFIANEKSHSIADGLQLALLWCTVGILIPLVVERVVWPWLIDRLVPTNRITGVSNHNHSNGNSGACAGVTSSTIGSGVSTPREEPLSLAALLVSHGHHHGHTRVSSATTEVVSTATLSSPSPPPPPAALGYTTPISGRSSRRTRELAAAVLIAILMSVHSATEGVAVGVEQTVLSLKQSVTPLVVHKIFDGWLVGIGAFRASDSKVVSLSPVRAVKTLFTTSPQRFSLIIWLAALPAFLLVIAPFVAPSMPSGVSVLSASSEQSPSQQRNVAPHLHSHPPASLTVAVAQATSSGSFLYVALCAILVDELSSTESIADITKRVRKSVLLVSSAIAGLVLGSLLASGHD